MMISYQVKNANRGAHFILLVIPVSINLSQRKGSTASSSSGCYRNNVCVRTSASTESQLYQVGVHTTRFQMQAAYCKRTQLNEEIFKYLSSLDLNVVFGAVLKCFQRRNQSPCVRTEFRDFGAPSAVCRRKAHTFLQQLL